MGSDYYKILGVDRRASEDEIKRAYRQLTKKYHPDRNPDDPATEARFKEVQEAYEGAQSQFMGLTGAYEDLLKAYNDLGKAYGDLLKAYRDLAGISKVHSPENAPVR